MHLIETTPNGLLLDERFLVDPKAPLPTFNTPTGMAFHAFDIKERYKPIYALVCNDWPVPNFAAIHTTKRMAEVDILQQAVAYGIGQWPGITEHRFMIILKSPQGPRFSTDTTKKFTKIDDTDLVSLLLRPFCALMRVFELHGANYRHLRLSNLFYTNANKNTLFFGEHVSTPPGYLQPEFLEPLERILGGHRESRGSGTIADDMFALGGVALCMLLGQVPIITEKPEAFLEKRLSIGSFKTLTGRHPRISTRMLELLEGLLTDRTSDRWTLNDVEDWLDNQKQSNKSQNPSEAARSFDIGEYKCFTGRAVAHQIAQDWTQGAQLLTRDNALETWVRRNLKNEELADRINTVIGYLNSINPINLTERNRILTQICLLLDREGPIRWETLTFMPDGFHQLIARSYLYQQDLVLIRDVFRHKLVSYWTLQNRNTKQANSVSNLYDIFYIPPQEDLFDEVIFRLMYRLIPGLACLSTPLKSLNLAHPKVLLPYLDANLARNGHENLLSDPHVLAFLVSTASDTQSYPLLSKVTGHNPQYIEKVKLFADAQRLHKIGPLPQIAQRLVDDAVGIWGSYKSLRLRQQQHTKAATTAEKGQISEVLAILNDQSAVTYDAQNFRQAQQEYALASQEIAYLKQTYIDNKVDLEQRSYALTTLVAMSLAALTLIFNVLYGLKGG